METVRIYRLEHLPRTLQNYLRESRMEAARVWNLCKDIRHPALLGAIRRVCARLLDDQLESFRQ